MPCRVKSNAVIVALCMCTVDKSADRLVSFLMPLSDRDSQMSSVNVP